ncbi:DUF3015 domain-containing protein [Vibrio marisflavi]|uniref:DUF3015 domain-containing protein n=1 Tax=Vibrio marisflavi CECT 7928 TaxID=634439 RepID=A0ABM9A4Z9_9VIBR|nr:DUF3015 domain-containing protein [Vibrio marisflavi]CAH0540151.1 hypothetical protein VMF7928_02647 [Vibrio marisflavi CECT 7928]
MKKVLATVILSAALPVSNVAFADPDIGCGLGTMVFDGQKGKVSKILGATTNGTSGNQTFGITFGTLGCDGSGTVTSSQKVAMFIDGNLDNLARDIAKGDGETLATLSEVWGVQAEDKQTFNQFAQQNFAEVFKSENVTSSEVFTNLNTLLAEHDTLSQYTI